jgi:hypothetical protein
VRSAFTGFFVLLGIIFMGVLPFIHRDIIPIVIDAALGAVAFGLAYASKRLPIKD